nr:hypothetical protein [Paenibacillus elgii]
MDTTDGAVSINFVDKNEWRLLDYYIHPVPGLELYYPMRVVPSGTGSEVMLTQLQPSWMTDDEQFAGAFEVIEIGLFR